MFYHTYILTKRGPFAKIWLAAHWDRKLSKNDVKVIDLSQVVLNIIEPVVPISLRTSGELMLGVVRVYGHKVRILLKESQDAAHELVRGKDTNSASTISTKSKKGITNEAISAVTYTDPIDSLPTSGKQFDKEFAQIESLVMNSSTTPAQGASPIGEEQALINTWFRSGPDGKIDSQQYNPANTFLDFRNEINRDFFNRRDDAGSLSDPSKKSTSSGSSIEALRRASVVPPSAEKNRFHIDVGLPVEETADLPDIPDLSLRTPFKLPEYMEEGEAPVHDIPNIEDSAPPRKKRLITKSSLVDQGETVISSESYRRTMKDPKELLLDHYPTSANRYPDDTLLTMDSTAMLAEETPWKSMEQLFAEELKAGIVVGKPDAPAPDVSSTLLPPLPEHEEEAMIPEFGGNAFSPMQQFGETGFPEFPMEDIPSRYEAREQMSGALLDNLRKNANADGNIVFGSLIQAESKKVAAQSFGDLLALISTGEVTVQQRKPFDDILITV